MSKAHCFVPTEQEVYVADHDLPWYGEPLPKDVSQLVQEKRGKTIAENIAAGMLRVLYGACYPNGIHKNTRAHLVSYGASPIGS